MYDKIILRKNHLQGHVRKNLWDLTDFKHYSPKNLIKKFGYQTIMEKIFEEEKEEKYDDIKQSKLYKAYEELLNSEDMENEYFIKVYLVDPKYGLELSRNIYLYRLLLDKEFKGIVPWLYSETKKYLGDTWWETDEEILENLKKMHIIEFLEWYQGYFG